MRPYLAYAADPIPYLRKLNADAVFMDDGARGTRYAPLYANSGFYFIKYNAKTKFLQELMLKNAAAEIGTFHSHQAVLSKHLYESMFLFDLKIRVVDKELFPSGKMYHDSKAYIARMMAHEEKPFVFHMCWTTNKHDKVCSLSLSGLAHSCRLAVVDRVLPQHQHVVCVGCPRVHQPCSNERLLRQRASRGQLLQRQALLEQLQAPIVGITQGCTYMRSSVSIVINFMSSFLLYKGYCTACSSYAIHATKMQYIVYSTVPCAK